MLQNRKYLLFFKIIIVFVLPAVICFYLYPITKEEVRLEKQVNKEYILSVPNINDQFPKFLLANLLNIPLNLDWYDICVLNQMSVSLNNRELTKDEKQEAGIGLSVIIYDLEKQSILGKIATTTPHETIKCIKFNATVDKGFTWKTYDMEARITVYKKGKGLLVSSGSMSMGDSKLFVRNNRLALSLRYITLFLIWWGIILLVRGILGFVFSRKINKTINMKQDLHKEKSLKYLLFYILLVFVIFIFVLSKIYGFKVASEIIQSLGIGLGSFFAGLAGLTAFLEWHNNKTKRAEKYIEELKGRYPRKLLSRKKIRIMRKVDTNMIYLLDERDKTSRWFQDQEARKDLGFSSSDTSGDISENDLAEYSEDDPIVSKKNYKIIN